MEGEIEEKITDGTETASAVDDLRVARSGRSKRLEERETLLAGWWREEVELLHAASNFESSDGVRDESFDEVREGSERVHPDSPEVGKRG